MKPIFNLSVYILLTGFLLLSCKKEEVPTVTTTEVTNIDGTSAKCGGTITGEGTGTVLSRGVCWSTGTSPTIEDSKTTDGAGAGTYASNVTSLNGATTYYIRAYGTNESGTGYGMAMSFKTLGQLASASIGSASNVGMTTSTLTGLVNANYLSTSVMFEYGETTGYGNSATANPNVVNGNSSIPVNVTLTELIPATSYHYRIKVVNGLGTAYSDDGTFQTDYLTSGNNYAGGIVCYVDQTGKHGIVAASADQSNGIQWYNGSILNTGATGTAIGSGRSNTTAIIAAQGSGNYAAKLCEDLSLNGYSDWFLPSKDELNTLYINLKLPGIGGFINNVYWSSSDNTIDGAWGQSFSNGFQGNTGKDYTGNVRAIRTF